MLYLRQFYRMVRPGRNTSATWAWHRKADHRRLAKSAVAGPERLVDNRTMGQGKQSPFVTPSIVGATIELLKGFLEERKCDILTPAATPQYQQRSVPRTMCEPGVCLV